MDETFKSAPCFVVGENSAIALMGARTGERKSQTGDIACGSDVHLHRLG